jgi:Mg2+ and Co2+ transporter CorA
LRNYISCSCIVIHSTLSIVSSMSSATKSAILARSTIAAMKPKELLRRLMRSCKTDLRELEKVLTKYKSLETKDPRLLDRIGFSQGTLVEIRAKLATHRDRFNLFLTQLHTSALGRIESNTDVHTEVLSDIQVKLETIHQDVRAGRKSRDYLQKLATGALWKKSWWTTISLQLISS